MYRSAKSVRSQARERSERIPRGIYFDSERVFLG